MSFLDVLNETLGDPGIDAEKLHDLMNQTVLFLQDIKVKALSKDPKLVEEAMRETVKMHKILQTRIESLCAETGLSPQELSLLGADTSKMNPDQARLIETLNEKFDSIKKNQAGTSSKPTRLRTYA